MWQRFPAKVKREIEEKGVWHRPSEYGEPYPITRGLIEEGRNHLLLGAMIETGCPVRILQGVQDPDVPWNHAVELTSRLAQDDVVLTLGQGRRPPPLARRGHRAADRGGAASFDQGPAIGAAAKLPAPHHVEDSCDDWNRRTPEAFFSHSGCASPASGGGRHGAHVESGGASGGCQPGRRNRRAGDLCDRAECARIRSALSRRKPRLLRRKPRVRRPRRRPRVRATRRPGPTSIRAARRHPPTSAKCASSRRRARASCRTPARACISRRRRTRT